MALVAGRLRGLSVALVALEYHLGAWRGFASQSRGRLWPSAMRARAATPVAQPHRPLKGTILRVEPDFWEVEVPGTGSGQVRKQHMVQPGRPGQQVTVYALQASPLGGLDFSLTPGGKKTKEQLGALLEVYLKRNGKFLALKPSSPPEDVKDKLGLSKSQFKTAVHELRKANRLIVSEEGVSLLPSKRTKRGGGEEAALLRRHKAAARASILARVPEAEEAYGLRAAADEALHLLPPSARNALLELPGGVRHGVPQTLAPHKRAARLRRQRQGMRASAVVNDPANRMVFALEEEPAFVEGSGGAPSSGAGLAPPVPPGMKAVAGRSTLSPAKQAELRRMEKEGDFEVLDTYVPADKPQTPPPQAAASMQEARQEPSSAPAAPVPLRAVAQAVDSMARKKRGGAAAANSVLIQDQSRLEELLEVAPGEAEEGEQSDLAYFMRVLGEDVGQYGDIFSEGEQGVQEALAHPNILHLRRAVAEGSVDPATLTGSTRAALAESLRSSRIPEHRHVLARIRALESGAEGDER